MTKRTEKYVGVEGCQTQIERIEQINSKTTSSRLNGVTIYVLAAPIDGCYRFFFSRNDDRQTLIGLCFRMKLCITFRLSANTR